MTTHNFLKLLSTAILLSLYGLSSATAFQWPSQEVEISASFGQKRANFVSKDMLLSAATPINIYPVEEGAILFAIDENSPLMPTRHGATLAIEGSDGMRAIYSHFDKNPNLNLAQTVTLTTVLGSGKVNLLNQLPYSFAFTLYDNPLNQYVNPLLFLPTKFALDKQPIIQTVYIRLANGEFYPLSSGQQIPSGDVSIFVKTYVPSENYRYALLPYSLSLEFMGSVVNKTQFDAFASQNGRTMLPGSSKDALEQFYNDTNDIFCVGSLNLVPGQIFINVKVRSIFNKEQNVTYQIYVVSGT